MKRITHRWLKEVRACEEQRLLFKELYPRGISVCWKCFREAQNKGLDVDWLAGVVSYEAYCELEDTPILRNKRFPKLETKYDYVNWIVTIRNAAFLKRLEKAFLEDDFDVSQL